MENLVSIDRAKPFRLSKKFTQFNFLLRVSSMKYPFELTRTDFLLVLVWGLTTHILHIDAQRCWIVSRS